MNIRTFNTNSRVSKHLNLNNYNNLLIEIINNQEKNDNEIIIEIVIYFKPKQSENTLITISKVFIFKILSALTDLTLYKKQ